MSDTVFPLTTKCNNGPSEGVALFPPGHPVPKGVRVLLETKDTQNETKDTQKRLCLKGAPRGDQGAQGLCLSQAAIDALGGTSAEVTVRGLGFFKAIRYDSGLRVNVLLALLAFLATITTGVIGYTSVGPEDPPLVLRLAPIALILAGLIAAIRLWKSLKEA